MPYLDDVLVLSRTFEDHVKDVREVLQWLREHGIKLKQRNCDLFKAEVPLPWQVRLMTEIECLPTMLQ